MYYERREVSTTTEEGDGGEIPTFSMFMPSWRLTMMLLMPNCR